VLYKTLIKPVLFKFPAENAHHISTKLFRLILSIPILSFLTKQYFKLEHKDLETEVLGLKFSNPVGLAAGFDKDGKYYDTMSILGFGFIEIGTVTPLAQVGNPQPRLFRLPSDGGLINRMGFNNEGVDALVERLKKRKKGSVVIGGNIGKNKNTPNDQALNDYEICFEKLYPHVDYFVLNVSSPNTPGLRSLQDKEPLTQLLSHIVDLRKAKLQYKPVLLKIAPDLNFEQIDDVLDILKEVKIDGIIATNTTISRDNLKTNHKDIENIGNGGLSGLPLQQRALEVVRYIREKNASIPIIGVGGISHVNHASEMLEAGANLVQIYSGMVYQGPSFVKKIKINLQSYLNN